MRHFSRVSGTSKQQGFLQVQPLCKRDISEGLTPGALSSVNLGPCGRVRRPRCVCGPQEPSVQSPAQQQASPALHLPPETFLHLSSRFFHLLPSSTQSIFPSPVPASPPTRARLLTLHPSLHSEYNRSAPPRPWPNDPHSLRPCGSFLFLSLPV